MEKKENKKCNYNFFKIEEKAWVESIEKKKLVSMLKDMLLIRNFEVRAESAYQQGLVGGFFHSYMGQEAIQTGAINAIGVEDNWWITTYRCHAMALLLNVSVKEAMAELYGKASGNALGRGGSMHFYSERMLGGFGIVGGHLPIATGAAFSLKYLKQKGVAVCFLGEGAVVQGAVHESLNLASLWDLPCIYVIENNQWGMGTGVNRAVAIPSPIAENFAKAYNIKSYTLDGMDLAQCHSAFSHIAKEVKKTSRPVLVEAITERYRGHSISDPALYRSKDSLEEIKKDDPITRFTSLLKRYFVISEEQVEQINQEQKEKVIAAMKFAKDSPFPNESTLEEGVFSP